MKSGMIQRTNKTNLLLNMQSGPNIMDAAKSKNDLIQSHISQTPLNKPGTMYIPLEDDKPRHNNNESKEEGKHYASYRNKSARYDNEKDNNKKSLKLAG